MQFTTEDDTLDFGEFDNMDPEEFKNIDGQDFGEELLTDLDKELGIEETSPITTTSSSAAVTVNDESKNDDKLNSSTSSAPTTTTEIKKMDKNKEKEPVANDKNVKPSTQSTGSTTTTTAASKSVNNNITNNNNNQQSKTSTKAKSATQYNNTNNMQRYNQPNRNYMYNQYGVPFNPYNILPNGLPYNQGFINGMPMNGMQAMAYNMNGNMNMNMSTNMNAMQPRRIHINPKFAGARPPQIPNTINQSSNANGSLNNNNNNNKSQPSNINQASNPSAKRSSNEAFTNNNESNDRDQKQRKTNNHTHASSSTSSPRHSSSSSQIKSSSPSTTESTRINDSVRDTKENRSHRQQLSEQRHTSTTGRDRDIAGAAIEAREKRREFLKTERETLERGEDYKIPTYNPLGVRNSGVKPIPFTKTSMFSIRGAALAAAESISPSTKDNNSNVNRSNQYLDTRHGNPLGVQHNNSSNNRITKNKVPIQQRLGNMNGSASGNGNESNKNKNNHPTSSPQRNNNNGASNPIPISTNGKSSKLKINYIANDVNDANIRAMEYGSGIKYIKFNREKETAIAEFNSIDNAVNFRRKHNRSLLSGKHISISFCTGSD